MQIWPYLLVYVGSTLVDCVPVFAPPAWIIMLLMMLKFDLNPWVVVTIGTLGTVTGRLIFSTYIIPWLGKKTLNHDKSDDLKFLGKRLSHQGIGTFLFVLAYSFLPLPTTALFTAAGLARVNKFYVVPPFALGNLIGDAIILVSGKYAIASVEDLFKGSYEPKDFAWMVLGVLLMIGLLIVDWRELLMHKKITIKWHFWKYDWIQK